MGLADAHGDGDYSLGSAVAVDGDTAVVGAPDHDLPAGLTGAAYVFVRTAGVWTLEAELSPSGAPSFARFGMSTAISGNTVVVGAGASGANAAYVFVRSGGVWTQEARLVGSPAESFDGFGSAVSVSGDTALVGSPEARTGVGFAYGSAYVFERSGGIWTERQKLRPAGLAAGDRFGESVSVSGASLVVGSPGSGVDAGSAYVFVRSGDVWVQEKKLTAAGGAGAEGFGSSISMQLDTVAVGAPLEAAEPYGTGAVHLFRRATGVWSEQQRIVASVHGLSFGAAVALDSDTLIVGSWLGAAYVFNQSGGVWTEEQRLPSSSASYLAPGSSVAVSDGAALAGWPGGDDGSGLAIVFRRTGTTWAEESRLEAPGTTGFDGFGSAVAFEGDVLAVGAPNDDLPGAGDAGSVYVFVRTGVSWTLQQKIVASDASYRENFGAAVALSGDTLAVSAPTAFGLSAVYVFVRAGGVWQQQQKLVESRPLSDFGFALSLDGDSLIVGAPFEYEGGEPWAGAAYVFVRVGTLWWLEQRLVSATPAATSDVGFAVALEGDTAIVGAPSSPGGGKVLAFRRLAGRWAQEGTLSPSDGAPFDLFGRAVALSSDSLIIGSPGAEVQGVLEAGAAYAFVRSGSLWTQQQKLVDGDPHFSDRLGTSVANSGNTAIAGAPEEFRPGVVGGVALFFERIGGIWTERQRIAPFGGAQGDRFAATVALSGGTAVVGAPSATTPAGFISGAAYVLVPAMADLALGFTGSPGSVLLGDVVTYTIVVTNSGPDAAPAVAVANSLDPGLVVESVSASQGTCTPTDSSVRCTIGVVPVSGSATVTVVAAAVAVGVFTSQASILWAGSDPVPGNQAGSVSTTVAPGGAADVSITKSGPSLAAVGSTLTYQIQIANLGPSSAAGVEVHDATPPGLTMRGTFGACTSGFPCTISRIPSGESRSIHVTLEVPPSYTGPDPIVNTASVTTATPDEVPGNDTSTVETPFFVPGGTLLFHVLTPCRLLDTRDPAQGGPDPFVGGNVVVLVPSLRPCAVPFGARALALNVTVTQSTAPGDLRLYPGGMPVPLVSTINYAPGRTRANNAVAFLSSNGTLAVKVGQAWGTVHVILDVYGYFE